MQGAAIFVLSLAVSAVSGQFLNCDYIKKLDCASRPAGVVCGTDGVDYNNRCFLAQTQCDNSALHIVTDQTCAAAGYTAPPTTGTMASMTTQAPASGSTDALFQNHNALLDYFCLELMHESCPDDTEQVCGTDNVSYDNYCEYEKQRCSHRGLAVKTFGACA